MERLSGKLTCANVISCPAVGKAAAGKLCVYTTGHENEIEPEIFDEAGNRTSLTHGFAIQFETEEASGTFLNAVWA